MNKEKNKWNIKSYKEGMDNFVFLTNTTNNETTRIIETTDFICNYSFEATVLMVAKGGDGSSGWGGGGGGYYYNKNFKFTEGHTYTFTIGTDDYTFTDNINGSTIVCTNTSYVQDRIEGTGRNTKLIKGGPRAGTSIGTGEFLKDKNSKRVIFFLKLASLNKVPKRKSQCTDTKINWRIETAFWKIKYYLRLVLTFHILLKFRKMLRNSKNAGVIAKKLLRCCHLRKN
jgi:hypothetical protein